MPDSDHQPAQRRYRMCIKGGGHTAHHTGKIFKGRCVVSYASGNVQHCSLLIYRYVQNHRFCFQRRAVGSFDHNQMKCSIQPAHEAILF